MGAVKRYLMSKTMDDMGSGAAVHIPVTNISKTYKIKVCKR